MGKLIDAEKLEQFISDNTDHFEISSMDIDACYVPRDDLIDAINSGSLDAPTAEAAQGLHEVEYSYSSGADVVQLLACPFCGGVPFVGEIPPHKHLIAGMPEHHGSWTIECGCGSGLISETLEAVTARWNTRAAGGGG